MVICTLLEIEQVFLTFNMTKKEKDTRKDQTKIHLYIRRKYSGMVTRSELSWNKSTRTAQKIRRKKLRMYPKNLETKLHLRNQVGLSRETVSRM